MRLYSQSQDTNSGMFSGEGDIGRDREEALFIAVLRSLLREEARRCLQTQSRTSAHRNTLERRLDGL